MPLACSIATRDCSACSSWARRSYAASVTASSRPTAIAASSALPMLKDSIAWRWASWRWACSSMGESYSRIAIDRGGCYRVIDRRRSAAEAISRGRTISALRGESVMTETSDREARAAQNELVFRAVNEQIVKMTERFREQLSDIDIVCECANTSCVGTIRVHADEFARIERAEGTFLVLPGHEDESVEQVLERSEGYFTVWKPSVSADGGPP